MWFMSRGISLAAAVLTAVWSFVIITPMHLLRYIFAVCLCLFSSNLMAKDSWWLNAEFEAKDSSVLEIPAKQIDSAFDRVSLLTVESVMSKFPEAKSDLADSNGVFSVDVVRGHEKHRIVVGVYSGTTENGSFLLVAKKEKSKWSKIFLKKYPGKMRFSVLQNTNDSILLNECLECGHGSSLSWNKNKGYWLDSSE